MRRFAVIVAGLLAAAALSGGVDGATASAHGTDSPHVPVPCCVL